MLTPEERIKKRKRILLVSAGMIILVLLLFAGKFLLDASYRSQIPAYKNLSTLSKPEQELIAGLSKKAYYRTTAANLGRLGMAYHSSADYSSAAQCYRLAQQKDAGGWIWNYYLGYMNLEQGEAGAAILNFNDVTQKDPQNCLALYYTAEAYQKTGHMDSAETILQRIATADAIPAPEKNPEREHRFPLHAYAMFQLARIYLNSGRTDSAELLLKAVIDSNTTFGPAYRTLGNVYTKKGNQQLATLYTIRANDLADYVPVPDYLIDKIALESRSSQYLLKQVEDAVRSGDHRWALTLCNHAIKFFPDNKYFVSNAMYENFRIGKDKEAMAYLDKHFLYFSNDAKELMDATDLLYEKGQGVEAMKYFYQVKKLIPQNSSLATWLYERGKKQESVVMMNELVKNNPENTLILSDVIRLLVNMGDDDLAKQYIATLNRLSPGSAELYRIKGFMAEKNGDLPEAAAMYEQAFRLNRTDLILIKEMIEIDTRQKNWQQAILHFDTALVTHPNEPFLLEGLGRMLVACPDAALRNMTRGAEYLERAFISYRSPYNTKLSAGKNLATVYVSTGDKKKAVRYINETIELAKAGNVSEEYVSYFRTLAAGR